MIDIQEALSSMKQNPLFRQAMEAAKSDEERKILEQEAEHFLRALLSLDLVNNDRG